MKLIGNATISERAIVAGNLTMIASHVLNKDMIGFDLHKRVANGRTSTRLKHNPENKRELYAIGFTCPEDEKIISVKPMMLVHAYKYSEKEVNLIGSSLPEFFSNRYISAVIFTRNQQGQTFKYKCWVNREDISKESISGVNKINELAVEYWTRKFPIRTPDEEGFMCYGDVWRKFTAYIIDPSCETSIAKFIGFVGEANTSDFRVITLNDFLTNYGLRRDLKNVIIVTKDYAFATNVRCAIDNRLQMDVEMKAGKCSRPNNKRP